MIGGHPEITDRAAPSLGARQGIAADAAHSLAAAAASRAIAAWGRPAAAVTHLVVCTNAGVHEPGADLRLAGLLGLPPAVRRTLLYLHGCSAGAAAFPLAKNLAENDDRARVLVVCAEAVVIGFGAPDEANPEGLVVNSLFGDGAGAVIVGDGPVAAIERPIFRMVSSSQATLPGTEPAVWVRLGERGLGYNLSAELPALVRSGIEKCLADAVAPLGLAAAGGGGWNSLFWAMHPGGHAILDSYEAALGLEPEKLAASRRVLGEYGNMLGATIIFVLDEVRRRRQGGDVACEWGVMLALGPGLTVETMVLQAAGSRDEK